MNKETALETRQRLRLIIDGYESFLFQNIQSAPNRVQSVEALATRDIIRTVAMSEVSKKRADRYTDRSHEEPRKPEDDAPTGTVQQGLLASSDPVSSVGRIASAAQPSVVKEQDRSSADIFRSLEDCIPCNRNWSWGDFDLDRLKEILKLDIQSRFKWLTEWDKMLGDNPVLDRLCGFLHAFRDLCPQDLLVLIAMLQAYITKTLDSIKFNLDGLLKDILGMVLRPYIGGIEDFLNIYIQFLVDQIDCILNLIQVSAENLRDMEIDIRTTRREGRSNEKIDPNQGPVLKEGGANVKGRAKQVFKKDIITGEGDKFLDDTAGLTKRTRQFLREDTKKFVHTLTDDIPTYLVGLTEDVLDWVEFSVIRAQDAVIDILGGEWLVTGENMTALETMRSVATIINILEIIVNLGNISDLCDEDTARRVIEDINDRLPDVVVIEDDRPEEPGGNDPVGDGGRGPVPSSSGTPLREGTDPDRNRVTAQFSLSNCLQKTDEVTDAQIRQWIGELS